ncbi:MAG: 5'-methylthioadenosine/adenosylhomocysteine nucleosidase [Acholeplasmatales bacterium]|nr:5'-methylthioadenosine/adenosylhomocysteine nucleosidase [Acholeplasmatales bacterium]
MIGIIAAMNTEMNIILDNMIDVNENSIAGFTFYEGVIGDNNVVICECGVGKVNSASVAVIMITTYEVDLVINTGIAGGLSNTKCRDVIIANGLAYHDFDIRIFGYEYGQIPHMPKVFPVNPTNIMHVKSVLNKLNIAYKEGIIISGDQFVSSLEKLEMVKDLGALACEMEGASIAQVCTRAGVDFIVLRYISDLVGATGQNEDYLQFEDEMANRSAKICLKLIENI